MRTLKCLLQPARTCGPWSHGRARPSSGDTVTAAPLLAGNELYTGFLFGEALKKAGSQFNLP